MYGKRMDLLVKLLTITFTDIYFYHKDYFEELCMDEENKSTLENEIIKKTCEIVNKSERVKNIDEINLIMHKYYIDRINSIYHKKNIDLFYIKFLTNMSEIFLTHRNGKICLKYWSSNDEIDFLNPYKGISKIAVWNSLNRVFTTDIVVILFFLNNDMKEEFYLNSYHSLVSIDDLQLEQILSKGMAETHMHFGAGGNFVQSWQELMTFKKKDKIIYELDHAEILGKNYNIEQYTKAASVVRYLMAKYLSEIGNNRYRNFETFLMYNHLDVKYICDWFYLGKDFRNINFDKFIENFKIHYNINERYDTTNNWEYDFVKQDAIFSVICNNPNIKTNVENVFLFKCLKYIKDRTNSREENELDKYFNKLFWQYIRIKNEVFSIKVQSNSFKGLDNFQDYYRQSTKYDYSNRKGYIGLILHNQLCNGYLKKLEVRLSIKDEKSKRETKRELVKNLIDFFKVYIQTLKSNSYKNNLVPQIGIIYHFIKMKDENYIKKCWFEYDGREYNNIYYKEIQRRYLNQIQIINELREEIEGLSNYIVGIDAASIENNAEPWVFAPVYNEARNSNRKPIYKSGNKIRNLGFTFHVGEDFRHIITGLRRIDECIEHFKFHAGDRVGHAIALGINVEKWIKNNNIVILPRIEYMENLLWLWGLYRDNKNLYSFDISYIERKVLEQAKKIYGNMEGITVHNLYEAYRSKFKLFKKGEYETDFDVKKVLFCLRVHKKETYVWNSEKLSHTYHCSCYLERMLELIHVEIKNEDAEMIKVVQKMISQKLSCEGIIVETNPSSNTAIGEIENLFDHYICNLNKNNLEDRKNSESNVMVTINTDDPSVFNTNLVNEYGYIFYTLLEKGYAREDILRWIDSVREVALNSSFIETREISRNEMICELCSILKILEDNYT